MRYWLQNGAGAALVLLVVLGLAPGQDPKSKLVPGKPDSLNTSLREVINQGAYLYNELGDYAGCYRVYQGALLAIRPQLVQHPDLLKEVDDTLKKAENMPRIVDRAFALRTALDHVREKFPSQATAKVEDKKPEEKKPEEKKPEVKTPEVKKPVEKKPEEKKPEEKKPETKKPDEKKPDDKKPEIKKSEEKKPEEKKQDTLWNRLGGEAGVAKVVAEFIKVAGANPKVNVTRNGKYPLDAKKLAAFERMMIEFVSEKSGGPLKYTGESMKNVHKGMAITNSEFDAAVADLKKALEKYGNKAPDVDAVLKAVDATRNAIVEEKKAPAKKEIQEDEPKKKVEDLKKEDKTTPPKKVDDKSKTNTDKATGQAKLVGMVHLDGKPGPTGYITLVGPDKRAFSTFIQPDGTYAFRTPLPTGDYRVGVETTQKEGAPAFTGRFPDRYLNPASSGLTLRLQPGDNVVDLNLTPQSP